MASQANLPEFSSKKKKQKIFGAMTTSRWIAVCVFLSIILYSYTAGPPLDRLWRINPYFRDYRNVDRTSMRREGNEEVIYSVFGTSYFTATWLQQMGSNFGEVEQFAWSKAEEKVYFIDSVYPKIFSYHTWTGLDIEYEYNDTQTTSKNAGLKRPGPNGIALHEKKERCVYLSEPSLKRIIQLNLITGKKTVLADTYNGKPLNAPYHLTVSPSKQYMYFTDPTSSSVFRVKLGKEDVKQTVELVTDAVPHPTKVTFSTFDPNRVYVGNCVEGDFSVFVFEHKGDDKWKLLKEWNFNHLQWSDSTIQGNTGCVRGVESVNGYLLATCPGGRVCIINEKTGIMQGAVKLFDNVVLNDVIVGGDKIWMASNYSFWRSYLSTGKKVEL